MNASNKVTPLDIAMYVPGLPFDGNTLKTRSLGGSESAAIYMAQALARLGHNVKVFSNTPEVSGDEFGVSYFPLAGWVQFAKFTPHDVTIVQRMPEAFVAPYFSKLNILWQHDLAQGHLQETVRGVMWNIDRIFVLSNFMLEQYRRVLQLPDEVFSVTRNGIDMSAFDAVMTPRPVRHRKQLVYASRPERGLDVLLRDIMPKLVQADPEITLCITGYDNPVSHMEPFYAECRRLAGLLGENVRWGKPLTKSELYSLYARSGLYVYPTPSGVMPAFAEVSCITAMECQAAGLPIVTSARGALPETIARGAGVLVDGDPTSPAYHEQFVAEVLRIIRHDDVWTAMSNAGIQASLGMTWDSVAENWSWEFEKIISENNFDPERLVRDCVRNSDIMLAQKIIDEAGGELNHLLPLLTPYAFAFKGREGFREQYASVGKQQLDLTHLFDGIRQEARYLEMRDWMRAHTEVRCVLDFGCAMGGYSVWGAIDTDKYFLGVDIDEACVSIGRQKAEETKANAEFMVGEWDTLPERLDESFDCVVLQEVLEHVTDPWLVLDAVERKAKKDGWVYITVPFGPWEYSSYLSNPFRGHIWHFSHRDLLDMVGHKKDLHVMSMYNMDSAELGTPMGWWVVTYRADHTGVNPINMNRRWAIQRPRETVSVSMIVGGELSEETLSWTLKSVRHVADEIVIADCGMTEFTRKALDHWSSEMPIRVVPGVNPREQGFDVARNAALDACRMDWVFWIDADERLVHQRSVHKYLRKNMFSGYGIRQHHFAVDTTFTPDMPVRLFRRDKGLRFFGAVHEHPEMKLNEGPGPVVILSDAHIAHVGYVHEDVRQNRFRRNYPLMQLDCARYPDRLLQKHLLMRDKMILVREALNANGNHVDAGIRRTCLEVIDLHRQYFLGKDNFANSDSLQYYSDACAVLGIGFEAAVSLEVDRGEAKPGPVARFRFANHDDFMAELTHRAKSKIKRFTVPEY